MPGSTPATSQLDWLISTTAMIVLSWSRATRDLLKSFGWGIRALHQLATATMGPFPRRLPHTISLLEGDGFELPVPREKKSRNLGIPLEFTDLVWLRPPEGPGALAPRVEEFEDAAARTRHRTRRGLRPSSADGGRPFTKSSPRCPPD